jgi:hypothetical protein
VKGKSRTLLITIGKAIVFLPICAGYLWWAYSFGRAGHDGSPPLPDATSLTVEMATIVTGLAIVVWFLASRIHRRLGLAGLTLAVALETATVNIIYMVIVLAWRESWTSARGMTETAAFMPILGHVNAEFFAEAGFWEFLIVVIPFVALLSGILTFGFALLERKIKS